MTDAPKHEAASNVEAPGPHTPMTTPTEVGNESGGEYQWEHSTATSQGK
jgi:hypothetical protein